MQVIKVLNFVVNSFPIIPIFLTMKFVHAFWKIPCFQCVDITQISWNGERDGMTHWNDKPLGFIGALIEKLHFMV